MEARSVRRDWLFMCRTVTGFGKSARELYENPLRERVGKHSPRGDSYYRSSSFWKTNLEKSNVGAMPYVSRSHSIPVRESTRADCCTYTPNLTLSRRVTVYPNLTIKCPVSSLSSTGSKPHPGPGEYDIFPIIGSDTSHKPSLKQPYSHAQELNTSARLPGPGSYSNMDQFGSGSVAFSLSQRFVEIDVHRGDPDPHTYRIKRWVD